MCMPKPRKSKIERMRMIHRDSIQSTKAEKVRPSSGIKRSILPDRCTMRKLIKKSPVKDITHFWPIGERKNFTIAFMYTCV